MQAGIFHCFGFQCIFVFKAKKELQYRLDLNTKASLLKSEFLKYNTLFESLVENKSAIRILPEADGLALISENYIVTDGITPELETIHKIIDWAYKNTEETIFISRTFRKDFGKELELNESAGWNCYLLCRKKQKTNYLSGSEKNLMITSIGQEIPKKKLELLSQNGEEKNIVSPRTSFETFKEDIKGNSRRWTSRNEIAIQSIRDVILETSHKQYVTIKNLNEQLKKVNEELDSFSYTISHDLGTPLTVMKLNAQMLLRSLSETSDKNKHKISSIIDEIDNMAEMMNDVLQLSRAKT